MLNWRGGRIILGLQMSEAFTICADCRNLSRHKSAPPWRWLCIRHKRAEGFGFVTREYWDDAPYLRCADVNGGFCPLFEKRAETELEHGEIIE